MNLPVDPKHAQQLIDNQTKELQLREQEISIKKQQDTHSYQYAVDALKTRERIEMSACEHKRQSDKQRYIFIFLILLLVAIIIGICLFTHQNQITIEIIKSIVLIIGASVGGYGYGYQRGKTKKD